MDDIQAQNAQLLQDMLNGHEVTNDDGQVGEDATSFENTATQETNTEDEPATAEKPVESDTTSTTDEDDDSETNFAEDESGKRYVPEKRFKDIYAKQKAAERENEALRKLLTSQTPQAPVQQPKQGKQTASATPDMPSKADILELKMTFPQFDPKYDESGIPQNPDYSPELDDMAYKIWKAEPGISPVDAARQAMRYAKGIADSVDRSRQAAQTAKTLQSDQGITSRVTSRQSAQVDPMNMTLEEKEQWLRDNGQW